jgi:hypothetical protein
MTDARALMWVAACRKYRILAEFAYEVLDERLRTYQLEIRVTDFDVLVDAKGVNAAEITRISPSTRARLRSGAFRMLREAEILDAESRVRTLPLSALRANKRETIEWLKFTLEGAGERTHGYAFTDTTFAGFWI